MPHLTSNRVPAPIWAILVLAAAATPPGWSADTLPVDVVTELIEIAPSRGSEEASIQVGALPPSFDFELPEGIEALAGVSRGEGAAAVGRTELSRSAAMGRLVSLLRELEWTEYQPRVKGKGFQPSQENKGSRFCREDGTSLWFDVRPSAGDESRVHMQLSEGRRYGCPAEERADAMIAALGQADLPFPTLYPPEGAKSAGVSGSSGGTYSREQSAHVETEMSSGELLGHYANQMGVAGWQPDAAVEYRSIAYQSWLFVDEAGDEWHGLMVVLPGRGENRKEVSMRVTLVSQD